MNDTICAISTAIGIGAISIIRVSGNESINIVDKIFDKNLKKIKSHTINYGHIIDNNEIIDEVMVSVMKSPKTFTKEDIVEINCHGAISTTNKILELLLDNGARLAEPGEFTKRAFLNGRIDLIEAESIMDLIESKTENSKKLSMNGIEGKISNLIREIIDKLLMLNANIEVNIDYPEYEDIEIITKSQIKEISKYLKEELSKLLRESKDGTIKSTFDYLTQDDVNILMSHINSIPRDSLNGKTPFEVVQEILTIEELNKLGVYEIKKDDVILKPSLFKGKVYRKNNK